MTIATPNKKRRRSPNYPSLDLGQSIDKARILFDADRRHAMPASLAHERWGYNKESSAAQQCEAALKAYGLLDASGTGDARKLAVSEKAERVLRDAPDRDDLLKEAALGPKIHAELWKKYESDGLPSDEIIRTYLLWDRETGQFNEDAVGDVIRRFRSSIALAKLDSSGIIEDDRGGGGDKGPISVGDYVQWTSDDKAQWKTPRKVLEFASRDGEQFVKAEAGDDDNGGYVPFSEVEKVEMPTAENAFETMTPSADGAAGSGDAWCSKNGIRLRFPFGSGNELVIIMRKQVSKKEFDSTVKAVYGLSSAAFVDNRLPDDVSDGASDNNTSDQS